MSKRIFLVAIGVVVLAWLAVLGTVNHKERARLAKKNAQLQKVKEEKLLAQADRLLSLADRRIAVVGALIDYVEEEKERDSQNAPSLMAWDSVLGSLKSSLSYSQKAKNEALARDIPEAVEHLRLSDYWLRDAGDKLAEMLRILRAKHAKAAP